MYTLAVNDVLRKHGFPPVRESCGLTKNVRKNRNRKIKEVAEMGGAAALTSLFASPPFNSYLGSARVNSGAKKAPESLCHSTLPEVTEVSTSPCGGWGRLPNISAIDYADDDPRGWVTVTRNKRSRVCMIQDESEY
jgi:hypothetical protein